MSYKEKAAGTPERQVSSSAEESSFIFVPRCTPWPPFQVTLKQLRERLPGKRIVVFEANAQNLEKYAEDIEVIQYTGQRFLAAHMHQQLQGKLDWSRCALVVVPVTSHDGSGYENVLQFAGTVQGVPAAFIAPNGQIKPIPDHITAAMPPAMIGGQGTAYGAGAVDYSYLDPTAGMPGSIDLVYHLDDGTLYLQGWLKEQEALASLAPSESDESADEDGDYEEVFLFRHLRADLSVTSGTLLGIAIFIPDAEKIPQGVTLKFKNGEHVWLSLPEEFDKIDKPALCLAKVGPIFQQCLDREGVRATEKKQVISCFRPLMADINRRMLAHATVAEEILYGEQPENPKVTVLVNIFKTYHMLRQQIADFIEDPFIREQEFLVVLDSVDEAAYFKRLMERFYQIYKMPMRLLVMKRQSGFIPTVNVGADAARGEFLLILNSDVFNKSEGWLESMLSCIEDDPSVGIVGARLLYPDESIQHVELSWRREAVYDGLVINIHPYKGLSQLLVPYEGAVEVDAVTGACMLVRTGQFREMGKLDDGFIRGDYDDSDICMRVRQAGLRIVCDNRAVLYHVEGVVRHHGTDLRHLVWYYNTLRHHDLWGEEIIKLLEKKG